MAYTRRSTKIVTSYNFRLIHLSVLLRLGCWVDGLKRPTLDLPPIMLRDPLYIGLKNLILFRGLEVSFTEDNADGRLIRTPSGRKPGNYARELTPCVTS